MTFLVNNFKTINRIIICCIIFSKINFDLTILDYYMSWPKFFNSIYRREINAVTPVIAPHYVGAPVSLVLLTCPYLELGGNSREIKDLISIQSLVTTPWKNAELQHQYPSLIVSSKDFISDVISRSFNTLDHQTYVTILTEFH